MTHKSGLVVIIQHFSLSIYLHHHWNRGAIAILSDTVRTLTELCSESHYHLISLFFLEMRAIIERPFLPALGWCGQFATEPYQVTTRNAFFIRMIDDTTIVV